MRLLHSTILALAMLMSSLPVYARELVMVHQPGCHYCERWTAEIGPIYPKTAEGTFAPLRRVRLGSDEMEALSLDRRVNFTPTFILVDDAESEKARIEGYPGEDFFWGLLEMMLLEQTDYQPQPKAGG